MLCMNNIFTERVCAANALLKKPFFIILLFSVLLLSYQASFGQANKIQGTVYNENGNPLPDVSVKIKGTSSGTISDQNGRFAIDAKKGAVLIFSFVGYQNQQVTVGDSAMINVNMIAGASNLNDVVVVGYGTQKKVTLTGAVSSVTAKEVVTTKNENLENSLTGKIPGLRVVQNSSEPGSFNNSIDIRNYGSPLVVIDGVPRDNITRIDANDVESISVLKDASAAVYGVRGANGVILITTKKGRKGALELTYNGTYGWEVPYGLPKPVDAVDYMILTNELSLHNVNGGHIAFTDEDIEAYRNGQKHSTNWYRPVVRKAAPQMQHNLSATGGNENTTYYVSLGYTDQQGIFKTGDLNYKRYNLRSNLSTHISKNLTFDINVSGIMDEKNQPYQDAWWIIRSFWRQLPTQTIYANNNKDYLNNGQIDGTNPVAMSNADINGYRTFTNRWFQSLATLNYNIPFVEGLSIKGLYSYDYEFANNKIYQKQYNQYSYDASTDTYNPITQQSPSSVRREFYEYPTDLAQLSLSYIRSFNKIHNVTALLLYEQSSRNADNFYALRELSIPVDQLLAGSSNNQVGFMNADENSNFYRRANKAIVGRLNYNFQSKYLVEFSFREDGSSQFGPGHQWGFFPAVLGGWRVSEENFWNNSRLLSKIDNFKLRASYGKIGDDASAAYQYITGYYYPAQGGANNTLPAGSVFGGTFVNSISSKGLPNPNITWYTSETFDAGVDIDAFKGLIGGSFDYFRRNRTGLLATELLSLPDVVGSDLPQENLNGDRAEGFDFEVTHRNSIGRFNYNVRGTFSYVRTMNTTQVQAAAGNSYLNWRNNNNNRNNNIYWGQGAAYRFESYEDILSSPVFVGRGTVVGDYAYEDWNGDGQIDGNDYHPVARTGKPMITYGLAIGGSYQGFDFNVLFQGARMVDVSYFEQLNTPLWGGGSALSQFLDRYHPADPKADPYDPNTVWVPGYYGYTGSIPDVNSLFNIQDASYIRLKSVEVGYTFPKTWLSYVGVKGIRVYANGYNIATFTKLKYLDPEHPSSTYGYLYPLDKIFSFGVNVTF